MDSFGLSSRVSDPTDVLLNNTSIKKASKELYEKAKIKKTLLQNINDLIDYLKTTDPKIIETIAEAPEQPAKSGIADLTDNIRNLIKTHGLVAWLRMVQCCDNTSQTGRTS